MNDALKAAALKAIKEEGEIKHDPLVYEVTSFETLAKTFPGEEDLVDRSILFYRMQGVRVLALKMTFNDTDYVVVYV